MKIKKLILKNINSLYGKWEINFDNEELRNGGLFAVIGNTGSGKTSILDAICLALYAETPRLSSGENFEVVSKGMTECLAELTFLDGHGQEWTSSFSYSPIRQGRNRGNMGKYVHRLMKGSEIVEDGTRGVKLKVEELTGLDKTRFCRAVLLAQGKFDAFLDAGNEKGAILEQITGTEIYSKISAVLKKRYDSEKKELEILEAEMKGIELLSPEVRAGKEEQMRNLQTEMAALRKEMVETETLCKLFDAFHSAETDLHDAEIRKQEIDAEVLAFEPEQIRLSEAEKAAPCTEKFELLAGLRKGQCKDTESLEKRNVELQQLSEQKTAAESEKIAADSAKDNQTNANDSLQKIVQMVIALDQDILNRTEQTTKLKNDIHAAKKRKTEKETSIREDENALAELETVRGNAIKYFAEHASDSGLSERKALWQEKKSQIQKQESLLAEKKSELKNLHELETNLQKDLNKAEKKVASEQKKAALREEELNRNKADLQTLLAGMNKAQWREKCEILQRNVNLAATVRSLKEERTRLLAGTACPLCGSTEHPYCTGTLPEATGEEAQLAKTKDILTQIDALETLIHTNETQLGSAHSALQGSESEKLLILNSIKLNNAQLDKINLELAQIQKSAEGLRAELIAALNEFGLLPDPKEIIPIELEQRIAEYKKHTDEFTGFERKKQAISEHLATTGTALTEIERQLAQSDSEFLSLDAELTKEKKQRVSLFGERNPQAESAQSSELLKKAEESARKCHLRLTQITERETTMTETITRLNEAIVSRGRQIEEAETAFHNACEHAGITPETYLKTVISADERLALTTKKTMLVQKKTQIEQAFTASRAKFESLKTAIPEDRTEEAVRVDRTEKEALLQTKNQAYGGLNVELARDEEDRQKKATQIEAIERRKKDFVTWALLYDFIGSKDSFQRIAQGITLDRLLVLSNIELNKLSDRYVLIHGKTEPLGIDVADRDQGDLIRPCKNLSGGERFLVSLSLALGLSRMAGEKIRVDSLFLDEGFGTLDPDSLQTALNALETLRNSGKMVGIISHVSGIGESIPCVIEVTKTGGGRSSISGPGVRKWD